MNRLAVVVVCVALAGCLPSEGKPERQFQDIKEADELVKGKTPDEVIKALGRPTGTLRDAWKDETAEWTYRDRLFDRAKQYYCKDVLVQFKDGKASGAIKNPFE